MLKFDKERSKDILDGDVDLFYQNVRRAARMVKKSYSESLAVTSLLTDENLNLR